MTAPRPGSTIDRAVRTLQSSGPLPRAELARLIEREDDELDALLRYGLRMGLLVRSNGDEDVSYALGNGVPLEDCAAPAAAAAAPVAQTTENPAREVVQAEPQAPARWPSMTEAPADRAGQPQAEPVELQPDGYRPAPGSKVEKLIAYLQTHAPHGGRAWLSARDCQAAGVPRSAVNAMLVTALKHGLVISRKDDGHLSFQAGSQSCGSAAPPPPPPPPPRAVPPAAAAPVATPAPAALHTAPPPSDDLVSFLRAQLETEIARLELNLRLVRRRKEVFELAIKGARLAPPQDALRAARLWASEQ